MNYIDYSEAICKAAETIFSGKFKELEFDITNAYTIKDVSNRTKGKYIVTDGDIEFEAYSEKLDYNLNDEVYVMIPKGDFGKEKIILGLKPNDNKPIKRNNLYNQMIISHSTYFKDEILGIIANGEEGISSKVIRLSDQELNGYTRMGIKFKVQSLLKDYDILSGEYGIKVTISYSLEEKKAELSTAYDCFQFIGNPYDFPNYSSQEIVYNIETLGTITGVKISLYQKGNFKNKKGELIPASNINNIKVRDVQIDFGIGLDGIDEEYVNIYSPDKTRYGKDEENNNKEIILRWVHEKKDGSFIYINPLDQSNLDTETLEYLNNVEIKWYRYIVGAAADDAQAGVYWSRQNDYVRDLNNETYYSANIKNGISDSPLENIDSLLNRSISGVKKNGEWFHPDEVKKLTFPLFFYTLIPNLNKAQEMIKVIIFHYNDEGQVDETYESNIIQFYNTEEQLENKQAIEALTALTLHCEDNSDGNYYRYDLSGQLLNHTENEDKVLQCYFNLDENNSQQLDNVEEIEWYIPRNDTMLTFDNRYYYNVYREQDEASVEPEGNIYGIYGPNGLVREYYQRTSKGDELIDTTNLPYYVNAKKSTPSTICLTKKTSVKVTKYALSYNIARILDQSCSHNYIYCQIKKDGIIYNDTKYFSFGYKGSNGTKNTLVLNIINEKNYIYHDDENFMKIKAIIYDENYQELALETKPTYSFTWYEPSEDTPFLHKKEDDTIHPTYQKGLSINHTDISNNWCEIRFTERPGEKGLIPKENFLNSVNILQCRVSFPGSPDLVALLGIPKCNKKASDNKCNHISGTQNIIYDSALNPHYSNESYYMYDNVGKVIVNNDTKWRIVNEANDDSVVDYDYPSISIPSDYRNIPLGEDFSPKDRDYKVYAYYDILNDSEEGYERIELILYYMGDRYYNKLKEIVKNKQFSEDITGKGTLTTLIVTKVEEYILPEERKWKININKNISYKNAPSIGIQYYTTSSDGNIDYNRPVWVQPIVIIHNNYFSQIINEWNGKTLGINEEGGYLLGKMLAAGRKNNDNSFTGVILGDWAGNAQSAITANTGLYGFNQGEMCFSFKDNGEATIGKTGKGQLIFDGNKGIIESGNYDSGKGLGMQIDYSNGILIAKGKNGEIRLNASSTKSEENLFSDTDYPLTIGENFKVTWDGSVFANNGRFTGTINAIGGTISGDMVVNGKLKGAIIESGKFQAIVGLNGYWGEYYETVPKDEILDTYDILLEDNKRKYWKIENNIYTEVNDNNELKSLQEQGLLEKRIIYWVPSDDNTKADYFPIQFLSSTSTADDSELTKPIVNIGMLRTLQEGKTNMFGIQTIIGDGNLTTDLGLNSGNNMRFHAKGYVGMSRGGNFEEPAQQVYLDTDTDNISYFVAKGMDKIFLEGKKEIKLKADEIILEQGKNSINLKNVPTKQEVARMIAEALTGLGTGGEKGGS